MIEQTIKRQEQIERVMSATVCMYGNLQGIAGKSLQEIEWLEIQMLGADSEMAQVLTSQKKDAS